MKDVIAMAVQLDDLDALCERLQAQCALQAALVVRLSHEALLAALLPAPCLGLALTVLF